MKTSEILKTIEMLETNFEQEEDFNQILEGLRKKTNEINHFKHVLIKNETKKLIEETSHVHARWQWDDDDYIVNGSCEFKDKTQADNLLKKLNTNWDFFHKMEWTGPGKYEIIPSEESDRCGDVRIIYTYKRI